MHTVCIHTCTCTILDCNKQSLGCLLQSEFQVSQTLALNIWLFEFHKKKNPHAFGHEHCFLLSVTVFSYILLSVTIQQLIVQTCLFCASEVLYSNHRPHLYIIETYIATCTCYSPYEICIYCGSVLTCILSFLS